MVDPDAISTQGDPALKIAKLNDRKGKERTRQAVISIAVLFAAIAIWWTLSILRIFPSYALPGPVQVWQAFIGLLQVGFGGQPLITDIGVSLYRIVVGFILASVIGIPLGIAMGRTRWVYQVIDPFVEFFRPVPPLAYIPVLVVWFGIGQSPKIILITVGTLPIIIINALSGVKSIPPVRLKVAESLGANKRQILYRVVLPSALPEIFTGLRVANGVAWTCLVAAELVAANSGLGWLVESAGQALRVSIVLVGIVLIGISGYGTELIVRLLERVLVPWKGKS